MIDVAPAASLSAPLIAAGACSLLLLVAIAGARLFVEAVERREGSESVQPLAVAGASGYRELAVYQTGGLAGTGRCFAGAVSSSQVFSLAIWVKTETFGSNTRRGIMAYHNGSTAGWILELYGSVFATPRVIDDGTIAQANFNFDARLGEWMFLAVTNGPTNGLVIYGASEAGGEKGSIVSWASTQRTFNFTGASFRLLGSPGGIVPHYGYAAEALYSTSELSAAQVAYLWNEGLGRRASEAASLATNYWGLQDASGGAVDEAAGGVDLTETGTTGTRTYAQPGPGAA